MRTESHVTTLVADHQLWTFFRNSELIINFATCGKLTETYFVTVRYNK